MPNAKMIKSVFREYGIGWAFNRALYSFKLKAMKALPFTEKWFEKKTAYPARLDLFRVDVNELRCFLKDELGERDRKKLVALADQACRGIITGFSSVELNYGEPLDWQLNPLTGKRCDEKAKWFRIPDFDEERGDIKVIWEASRFSHFVTLARAFLLTDDRKYYDAFSSELRGWLEKNPYSYGANYKCGQECSLRMINALLAYAVFERCGAASDADRSCLRDLVDRCYRRVLSNFFYAYRCIKNNHTISELMGMIAGAWCCGDRKRLEKAYRLLDGVIDEQFTLDGGYRQFSFNYQRLALQDLSVVLSVSGVTGKDLSRRSKEKIRNSAWLLFQCQDDSGDVPNYGSNDGALAFPLTSCGYRDFRPVINAAYALAGGARLYSDGKYTEELIWLSGEKKPEDYEIMRSARASSRFSSAGLFTSRGRKSWAMTVSNDFRSRPAHMDQLHLDLWVNGRNVLCDAGTYSYASAAGRQMIRNESHNTAVVDGITQMDLNGPFFIYNWSKRAEIRFADDRIFSKMVSGNGYCHERTVTRNEDTYEVIDKADREYSILFHTPCDVSVTDGKAVLSCNGKPICEIQSSGEIEVSKSQRSLYYLKTEETNCLAIHGSEGATINTTIKCIEGDMEK